jgi:GTP pyrophosphokinase
VLEYGGSEDVAIAAVLHDVVEDCGGLPTVELIRSRFGDHVTDIVLGCSDTVEHPRPPWKQRKDRYLAHLPEAGLEVLLVSAADKLHNLRSLLREERRLGRELWPHFRAGRDGTLWYYEQLLGIFRRTALPADLVEQIGELVEELQRRVLADRNVDGAVHSERKPMPSGSSDPDRKAS